VVKNGKNIRQDLKKQLLEKAAPKAALKKIPHVNIVHIQGSSRG